MFGQGNQAPRPGTSLQQLPSGAPQPSQQGGHDVPGHGRHVMQQLSYQSGPQLNQAATLGWQTQGGAPNMGISVHDSQNDIGSNQSNYHYPPIQQQHPQHGMPNLYHVPPPRMSLPPPPLLPPTSQGFQISESLVPPPPPPSGYIMDREVGQPIQPSGCHGVLCNQPQQPLLASVLHRITQSEHSSLPPHPPLPSSHSCASPVPPACPPSGLPISDGKELTSAVFNASSESPLLLPSSGGYPDVVKTNDVEATNELTHTSHNNDPPVTVCSLYNESENHASMINGPLVMNDKLEFLRPEAGSSSQRNSSTGDGLCSTSDSEMDMEDEILNLVEDLGMDDPQKDKNCENLYVKHKLHGQILTPASFTGLPSEGVICGHLPIKVKQVYAYDNSADKPSAKNVDDVSHDRPVNDESAVLKKGGEPNLVSDRVSENHCTSYAESNSVTLEHSLTQKKVTELGKDTEMDLKNSSMTSVSVSKPADVAKKDGTKEYSGGVPQHPSQEKGHLKPGDITSKHGKSHAEDTTASLQFKVDEFGRLAKNVSSDSDSNDYQYSRKRGRRGRSRSISPFERKRKTPMRRRYIRSRSRSHSPSRRRSRSGSPGYKRPTESVSDRRRRDNIQTSICFDFRDGKCHRGSSCRFLHHDSDKSGSSNLYKRKRLSEAAHSNRGSKFQERYKECSSEKGSRWDDKDESHGAHQLSSTNCVNPDSGRVNGIIHKNDAGLGITVLDHAELDQDDYSMVSNSSYKCKDIGGETANVVDASMHQVAQHQNATNFPGDDKNGFPPLVNSSSAFSSKEPLRVDHSAAVPQYANLQSKDSSISYESLSAQQQSLGTPHLLRTCDPRKISVPSQSLPDATTGLRIQTVVAENRSLQVPYSVTGTPFSPATTGRCMPQLHGSLRSMQTSACLSPTFIPGGGPSYNQFASHNQPPQWNAQQVPLWTPLPPPPPRASLYADTPNANKSTSGNTIPFHFERTQPSQRTNVVPQSIPGPYSAHIHLNSQYGGNHHYVHNPSVEAHRHPFALPMQRPDSLFTVNSHPQQTEGLHLETNEQTLIQSVISSTLCGQPDTSFVPPPATESFPSSETACLVSSQSNIILNNTSLIDHTNSIPRDSGIFGLDGKIEPNSLLTSSANLGISGISEFEHFRTSAHCNMHASASDRPLASMFSQPVVVRAQGVKEDVLREKSVSNISIRNTGQIFPESGDGQYDPLFDSFDKSSNPLVNSELVKKQRSIIDSDNMSRDNFSLKPLDVEETNRTKEREAIASLTSSENEEFGETADAEVRLLENESVSNLVDIPNRDSEVAISETYLDKKSKDSRSMKLFKCAIANFVKDTLKPSWRQGKMSKEAFKTIVKKTVEKVSGAMKGHRYPKSHAKINHYIDSSEHKLRKLVMGYVDKYVKE